MRAGLRVQWEVSDLLNRNPPAGSVGERARTIDLDRDAATLIAPAPRGSFSPSRACADEMEGTCDAKAESRHEPRAVLLEAAIASLGVSSALVKGGSERAQGPRSGPPVVTILKDEEEDDIRELEVVFGFGDEIRQKLRRAR